MLHDEIRTLLRAKPFQPFRVHSAGGSNVLVWHPDYGFVAPDNRLFIVYEQDMTFHMLNMVHVTGLELDAPPDAIAPGPPIPPA
jgi:hypothetical protein